MKCTHRLGDSRLYFFTDCHFQHKRVAELLRLKNETLCIYMCVCVCVYLCVCMCVYVHVCVLYSLVMCVTCCVRGPKIKFRLVYHVRGKSHQSVPAGSCHFSCLTDPSQSVVNFPCVQKREHIKTMCAIIAWDL